MHRLKRIWNNTGQKCNFAKEEDGTPALSVDAIKLHQKNIVGPLFYGRVVYMTIMVALITLESAQDHGTEEMSQSMVHILNYFATRPDVAIRYKKIDIILAIHSGASYLSNPKSHSWADRHLFLAKQFKKSPTYDEQWIGAHGIHHCLQCNVI